MSTKVGSMGSGRPVLGGHNTTRFFIKSQINQRIYGSGKYENLGESKWHLWLGGPWDRHARVAPRLAPHLSHCRLQQGATSDLTLFLESSMIDRAHNLANFRVEQLSLRMDANTTMKLGSRGWWTPIRKTRRRLTLWPLGGFYTFPLFSGHFCWEN